MLCFGLGLRSIALIPLHSIVLGGVGAVLCSSALDSIAFHYVALG